MIELLDEYIPFVTGSEINDDPFSQFQDLQRYYLLLKGRNLFHGYTVQIVSSKLATQMLP
jgi:hypothetical protein